MNATQTSIYLLMLALSIAVPWWLIVCRQDRNGVGDRLMRLSHFRMRPKPRRGGR